MSVELRKLFEQELQEYLKSNLNLPMNAKLLKKELSFRKTKENSASGDIGFSFINNAQGYILYTGAYSPELLDFYKTINAPNNSNKPENVVYSMSSSMEVGFKSFSPNMRGTVDLPKNEEQRGKACEWIAGKIQDIYLPCLMNVIEIKSTLIDDVLAHPDYYAYPFLTILYVIKKHSLPLEYLNVDAICSKKVVGNKSFDKNLLTTYFLV